MPQKTRYFQGKVISRGSLPTHRGVAHVVNIEGSPHLFDSIKSAYGYAKKLGFNSTYNTFMLRVNKGWSWDRCIRPVSSERTEAGRKSAGQLQTYRKRARDEMHEICAELDRRKAEMAK